jgi:hypothetical protein
MNRFPPNQNNTEQEFTWEFLIAVPFSNSKRAAPNRK